MTAPQRTFRAIIVDDEPAGREYVEELAANEPSLSVIGSFGDPRAAVEAVLRDKPDILFLDIQMPGMDGFELLECLSEAFPPAVVFITAFDKHAIDAFDVSAADYLLKPFDAGRFHRAIERAAAKATTARQTGLTETPAVLERLRGTTGYARTLPARVGDRIILQRVSDIAWFEAQGKYVHLHVGTEQLIMRHTMQSLEQRLDPERFVRVSRSAIINVDHVRHLEPWSPGDFVITLRSGEKVYSTQGYRAALRRLVRVT
jgi:two-component system LytT family response regulator